jgi:hypothetical protein
MMRKMGVCMELQWVVNDDAWGVYGALVGR